MMTSGPTFSARSSARRSMGRDGFTLVELLAVIGIISILTALVLGGMKTVQSRADQALCVSHLRDISNAIMLYIGDHQGDIPMAQDERNNTDWIDSISGYVDKKPDVSVHSWAANFTTTPKRYSMYCPSVTLYNSAPGDYAVKNGNYGMNRALSGYNYNNGTDASGAPAYAGSPQVKLSSVANPSQKILVLDAGYVSIYPSAQTYPNFTYTYIPGLAANKNMSWSPPCKQDALMGRHAGKVNILMVDGHVESWRSSDFSGSTEHWVP